MSGPSWEDIVNWVKLPSKPGMLQLAADGWKASVDRLDQVQKGVAQLPSQSTSWQGAGADAWRKYSTDISGGMQAHHDTYNSVWNTLHTLADALNNAIPKIPPPPSVVAAPAGQSGGYPPNSFYDAAYNYLASHNPNADPNEIKQVAQEYYDKRTQQAQQAYQEVLGAYRNALSTLPNPPATTAKDPKADTGTKGGTGGGGGQKPATATNPAKNQQASNLLSSLANALGAANTPAATTPTTTPLDTSALDPALASSALDSSGLDSSGLDSSSPGNLSTTDPLKNSKFGLASAGHLGGAGGGGAGIAGLDKLGQSAGGMMTAGTAASATGAPAAVGVSAAAGTSTNSTSGVMGGVPATGHGGRDGQEWRTGMPLTDDDAFGVGEAAPPVIT